MSHTAELVGGPLNGEIRVVPDPAPYEVTFRTTSWVPTGRAEIDPGATIACRTGVYRVKRDDRGVPWFTPNAEVHYDWVGWREDRS